MTLMTPLRTSIASSPDFKRRFLRLVVAQLDGQTCGLAEMAACLLADCPHLEPGSVAYETLEAMRGRANSKAELECDRRRTRSAGKATQATHRAL
jgi:hypothetical protein